MQLWPSLRLSISPNIVHKQKKNKKNKKNLDYFSIYSNRDTIIKSTDCADCLAMWSSWLNIRSVICFLFWSRNAPGNLEETSKKYFEKKTVFCFSNFALKKSLDPSFTATLNLFLCPRKIYQCNQNVFGFLVINHRLTGPFVQTFLNYTCPHVWDGEIDSDFKKNPIKLYFDKLLHLAI